MKFGQKEFKCKNCRKYISDNYYSDIYCSKTCEYSYKRMNDRKKNEQQKIVRELIDLSVIKVLLNGYITLIDLKYRLPSLYYEDLNRSLERIQKNKPLGYKLKTFFLAGHNHYSISL